MWKIDHIMLNTFDNANREERIVNESPWEQTN